MSGILSYLRGFVQIEIKGAEPRGTLNQLVRNNISIYDCVPVDLITIRIKASRRDESKIHELAERSGSEARTLRRRGAPYFLGGIKHRFALFLGLFLTIAALFVSSLHIWEIKISGNESVSSARVLQALETAGVGIGSFWPDMDIDEKRNLVMAEIPELRFLSVNVYGSRAEVVVRERTEIPEIFDDRLAVNVEASRSGIISEIRAYRGELRVLKGQTILEGDVLLSGAVNSFRGLRAEHASADVYAQTWYEISAAAPLVEQKKSYTGDVKTRFALRILDKRINFYGGTGISGASCDKIIEEHKLSVPGVFTLPVSLIAERLEEYESVDAKAPTKRVIAELEASLKSELLYRLGERGEIKSINFTNTVKDGAVYVTLHAECLENIATERVLSDIELIDMERQNEAKNDTEEATEDE